MDAIKTLKKLAQIEVLKAKPNFSVLQNYLLALQTLEAQGKQLSVDCADENYVGTITANNTGMSSRYRMSGKEESEDREVSARWVDPLQALTVNPEGVVNLFPEEQREAIRERIQQAVTGRLDALCPRREGAA
jgi:hypothetical protein